jgi:hypothetical protein
VTERLKKVKNKKKSKIGLFVETNKLHPGSGIRTGSLQGIFLDSESELGVDPVVDRLQFSYLNKHLFEIPIREIFSISVRYVTLT